MPCISGGLYGNAKENAKGRMFDDDWDDMSLE